MIGWLSAFWVEDDLAHEFAVFGDDVDVVVDDVETDRLWVIGFQWGDPWSKVLAKETKVPQA